MKNIAIFGFLLAASAQVAAEYQIGIGIADCTGPPAEITFVSTNRFDRIFKIT